MRLAPLALICALTLSGCATTGGDPQPANAALMASAKSMYAVEAAFDAAVLTAEQAVNSGLLKGNEKAKTYVSLSKAHSYLLGARQAQKAGDMIGMQLQTSLAQIALKEIK